MTDQAVTRHTGPDPVPGFDDAHPSALPDPEPNPGGFDLELVRRYKDLRARQQESAAEAAAMKEEADRLEERLVEMFSEAGVPSLQVDGKTVFLHRATFGMWAPGIDSDVKRAALRNAGAEDLVTETINANTLNAWVRELTDDDDAPGLPPELDGLLSLGEKFSVRINAAGTRKKSRTHSK